MIGKLVKAVFKAGVAQPWDYMGEGAPNEWEFRISPDEEVLAVWNPHQSRWVLFKTVAQIAEVKDLAEMDRNTGDWARYVEELDPDDFAGMEKEARARGWV